MNYDHITRTGFGATLEGSYSTFSNTSKSLEKIDPAPESGQCLSKPSDAEYTEKVGLVWSPPCRRLKILPRRETVCPLCIRTEKKLQGSTVIEALEVQGE